uniref:dioxygenase family protein n=1 Tax=Roseivirga sp. TaxID=1964215 RepID=UPI0040480214
MNTLRISFCLIFSVLTFKCLGQQQRVGGSFENSSFMYIGMPEHINATDTSSGWGQNGQKLLITGSILKPDGITPAPDVILYYYHTDVNGVYPNSKDLNQKVAGHGSIRGWVKSDKNGRYSIYTVRPEAYPNRTDPAHIHPSIKEPNDMNEYYLDEFVFDDDPLLTTQKRRSMENRGGSGVLRIYQEGGLAIAEHNIILGLNIPNYPGQKTLGIESGPKIGEDVFSFTPQHIWGEDIGSKTCPICKYGRQMGILYFIGDKSSKEEIKKWIMFLETEAMLRKERLKTFVIFTAESEDEKRQKISEFTNLARQMKIRQVAITYVPHFSDRHSEVNLNKINPAARIGSVNMFGHSDVHKGAV